MICVLINSSDDLKSKMLQVLTNARTKGAEHITLVLRGSLTEVFEKFRDVSELFIDIGVRLYVAKTSDEQELGQILAAEKCTDIYNL